MAHKNSQKKLGNNKADILFYKKENIDIRKQLKVLADKLDEAIENRSRMKREKASLSLDPADEIKNLQKIIENYKY